jgi:hypothetical protein
MRRLNLFQATMLRWRELYPYNAVHVVGVNRPLDATRLESDISRALESLGLTGLVLDSGARRYAWLGGAASDVKLHIVPGGTDPSAVRDAEIERQLNVAFDADGRIDPFRFFAIDAGAFFHLGIAYDHFVASGDSVARFLKNLIDAADVARSAVTPANPYAPSYARLFWRERRALLTGLASLPSLAAEARRSARPRYRSPEDGYNGFTRVLIEPAERAMLARAATTWQVSLHDVLLSISLAALSKLSPERRSAPRRREIAVASIINIRREMGPEAADAVAPCLASFRVGHSVPSDIGMRELTAAVHDQTDRVRQRKLHLQSLLAMALAGFEWRFLSREQRLRFYAKHYPVWAGITSLNINALWGGEGEASAPPHYVRAGSTGPLAPMVITLTASGEAIEAGLSFRTTVYSRDVAHGIAAGMLDSIRRLKDC